MKESLCLLGLTLAISLGNTGCSLPPTISGNGTLVTESRAVADFQAISIGGSGRAIVTQGDTESLEIEADENLLPYIESEVHNGQLRIWTRRGNLRFSKGPIYRVGVRNLDRLQLSGSLAAEIETLLTDRLDGGVSGSGAIQIGRLEAGAVDLGVSGSGRIVFGEGHLKSLDLSVSGSGDLQAAGVRAERVEVSISGSGSAQVWATESLRAHVSGSGDIRYKGQPGEVNTSVSGSGKVRRLD